MLAHLAVGDLRIGLWVFLGQVTCGKSDDWEKKIGEPKAPLWTSRSRTGVDPRCFLAVPHHVEPKHLDFLVEGNKRIVLDRLRLAKANIEPSEDERRVIEAVLATGLEQIL